MPRRLDAESWGDGASLAFMERLISHWRLGFDWRAQEDRLNRFPQFIARVGGLDVHFVHEKGKDPAPMPLVLTHGWPGSFAEMQEIIPLLPRSSGPGVTAMGRLSVFSLWTSCSLTYRFTGSAATSHPLCASTRRTATSRSNSMMENAWNLPLAWRCFLPSFLRPHARGSSGCSMSKGGRLCPKAGTSLPWNSRSSWRKKSERSSVRCGERYDFGPLLDVIRL